MGFSFFGIAIDIVERHPWLPAVPNIVGAKNFSPHPQWTDQRRANSEGGVQKPTTVLGIRR